VYQRCDKGDDEFLEWIRASCSMPLVSRPVTIGEHRLLDGGLADSMPLQWFQSQGYDRNVVILTRPAGYVKEPVGHRRALRWLLRRYPVVAQALLQRHELYNAQLQYVAQQEQLGNTLVFRPDPPLTIGHTCHDPEQMQATYEQGRRHGEQRIDEVAAFLRV
jgi:predicted patatin/cPLA2 family phospholipase